MISQGEPQGFVGSPCVYYTYRFFTVLQVFIGLGNILTGILICLESGSLDWYNLCYILTGTVILFLSMLGYTTYNSACKLINYLLILFICFCSELGFTLGILIVSQYDQYVGTEYAQVAEYSMFGASGILFSSFFFGCLYLSSLQDYYSDKARFELLNKS